MRKNLHPVYKDVVFQDTSSGFSMLSRSTRVPSETVQWEDGKEYPVIRIDISSASHPFYTGKNQLIDAAGRIDKFKRRYAAKDATKEKAKR